MRLLGQQGNDIGEIDPKTFTHSKCEQDGCVLETRDKPNGRIYLPEDRFVEYEDSDYPWLSFFGLASREQETVKTQVGSHYHGEFRLIDKRFLRRLHGHYMIEADDGTMLDIRIVHTPDGPFQFIHESSTLEKA